MLPWARSTVWCLDQWSKTWSRAEINDWNSHFYFTLYSGNFLSFILHITFFCVYSLQINSYYKSTLEELTTSFISWHASGPGQLPWYLPAPFFSPPPASFPEARVTFQHCSLNWEPFRALLVWEVQPQQSSKLTSSCTTKLIHQQIRLRQSLNNFSGYCLNHSCTLSVFSNYTAATEIQSFNLSWVDQLFQNWMGVGWPRSKGSQQTFVPRRYTNGK